MTDIKINYLSNNIRTNIYKNGFIEYLIFENLDEKVTHFQINKLSIFGVDKNENVLVTLNPSFETAPEGVRFDYYGGLDPTLGKIEIKDKVFVNTDIKKIMDIDIADMKKYNSNVIDISKISINLHFFNNNRKLKELRINLSTQKDFTFGNIVKIRSGLIEKDNPLLFSKITDFFGAGTFVRDEDIFTIYNGYVERNLNYKEFVLIVEKEPNILTDNDTYGLYTRISGRRSGLIECVEGSLGNQKTATHWKFIYYDGFIQTYLSYDNMNEWVATGGGQNIEQTDVQGFYVDSNTPLILKDYKTYSSPYTKFLNVPQGYYVKLYDNKHNLKQIKHSINGIVEIYMASPIENGYFTISNEKETVLYTSENLDIYLGDIFDDLQYQLEVWYGRRLIERYSTTHIDRYKEIISIKNISNKVYENVYMNILKENNNTDIIELSLNDKDYSDRIMIPIIEPNNIINVFIRITKDKSIQNYGSKNFSIEFN